MARIALMGALVLVACFPAGSQACTGDCAGDGAVTVDDVVTGVGIALGALGIEACPSFDRDRSGVVTIDELIEAVNAVLAGCPTPTPTPAPSITPTATATGSPRPIAFTDVTVAAGVDYVQYRVTMPPIVSEPEYETGGAAAGDYDGDGWTDLYVTRLDAPGILFRNRGDGTFADVTADAGLTTMNVRANGVGWADIDNDGDLDLYVTTLGLDQRRFHLFVNDGAGHFTEEAVARGAALEGRDGHFGFSVSFGDYDRDGWIDIHTSEWRPDFYNPSGARSNARLLHNQGGGVFADVTDAAGVGIDDIPSPDPLAAGTFPFSSSFVDLDDDGWQDLAIAADYGTSRLFWNNHDGTFIDGTVAAGVGSDENGMGSAIGDYDGDGRLDWFVTSIFDPEKFCTGPGFTCHWGNTGNRLYRNLGGRRFADHTDAAGVRDGYWGWGAVPLDYDNDGALDLMITNGVRFGFLPPETFVDDRFENDPMRLWRNDAGVMTEVSVPLGVTDSASGKGLLTFDYDKDGDLDVFVVNNAGHPVLYRNDGGNQAGWLRITVHGTMSNRDGLGARITVIATAGAAPQVREIIGGSHFLSQSELTAHFGLGMGESPVHEVRIVWPRSGQVQVLHDVPRNVRIDVEEPIAPALAGRR